jgi:GNAT superfamily N-acetyltransferase
MEALHLRNATLDDVDVLASFANELVRDGSYPNSIPPAQGPERMAAWLRSDFRAVIFEVDGSNAGYALYRVELEHVHLWQLFVRREFRRRGIGRQAIEWLWRDSWQGIARLRIDVFVGNTVGDQFWRAVGFVPYSITMEMERPIDS